MKFINRTLLIFLFMPLFVSCMHIKKEITLVSKGDSLFTFNFADQKLMVDAHGGRIISFQMNHIETIGPGGSTFWISPQSYWSWPPVKQHHEDRYSSEIKGDTLILKSKKDDLMNLEITKIIYSNTRDTSFTVRYGILNSGDSIMNIAPWENTRTFKSAVLFYPKGSTDSMSSNPVFGNLSMVNSEGINWFSYGASRLQGKNMGKLFADGKDGWICQANNGFVLIKRFPDITPAQQAPGEGEIEIFADLQSPFLEMEEQGPVTKIKPGETLWWEVKWILRELPKGIKVQEANGELLTFVKYILK